MVLLTVSVTSLGAVPGFLAFLQFLLLPISRWSNHLAGTAPYYPNVAVVIPAWDEAESLRTSIMAMMGQEYPPERIRVYLVDDASTDFTPALMGKLVDQFPGRVFYLRREVGGEGKAAALNYGFAKILQKPWAEALLIMDADVIFMPTTLRKMTRHLADPTVGAVACYIKEGSASNHWLSRYIAFEYSIAQASARRTFNVIGYQPCLAGGAQLHSRENFEAIGGKIDTTTLAEDTFTTIMTQQLGRQVIFEGTTEVWAEEPASLGSLWRQRVRWGRGNIQISLVFTNIWFRKTHNTGYFQKIFYDLIWFSLLLMPFLAITSTLALIYLYFENQPEAWYLMHFTSYFCVVAWVYVLISSLLADPQTARRSWVYAPMFPGAISLVIIFSCAFRPEAGWVVYRVADLLTGSTTWIPATNSLMILAYAWILIAMPMAWLAKYLDDHHVKGVPRFIIFLCGYGALLLGAACAAWYLESKKAERTWDKTLKSGNVVVHA
jgi:cellulose synthase/poly-beta-1,6-N-acetylglucosamine synthase-like glycosyltransferase